MKFIFAISYAQAISAFIDKGEDALGRNSSGGNPRRARPWRRSPKSPELRQACFRKIANCAGLIGAIPITQTSRQLSMSSSSHRAGLTSV